MYCTISKMELINEPTANLSEGTQVIDLETGSVLVLNLGASWFQQELE